MRGGERIKKQPGCGSGTQPSEVVQTEERIRNKTMDVRDDVCVQEAGGEEDEKQAGRSHNDVRVSPPVANSNKEELLFHPV